MSFGMVLTLGVLGFVVLFVSGIAWGVYVDPILTDYLRHRRRLRQIRYAQLEETERRSIR